MTLTQEQVDRLAKALFDAFEAGWNSGKMDLVSVIAEFDAFGAGWNSRMMDLVSVLAEVLFIVEGASDEV